nr:hypothetical protein [Tanacetum cinerariifolium]
MTHHKEIFDTPSFKKKVFANIKRVGTGFSGDVTSLFDNMLVQTPKEVGILQANAQSITITTKPSTSKPQKKHKPKRKHTQESEVLPTESPAEQNLPSPSNDPLPSGEDSLKLKELMDLCTNLSNKVLELESGVIDTKSTYQEKIEKLKGRVERLEEEKKVLSMMDANEEEPADVEEVLEVVKAVKLMTKVVTTVGATKVSVPRKRRGVIIQDPKETTTTSTVQPKVQAKDKGKAILIEEPKPLKRQMDYFKGMAYDEIRPLFEKHYNFNQTFLDEMEEETEELKIVTDDDDDLYTDATPLASKIPIVDYKIHTKRNRPCFKIIRADGNHIFTTLLKNFDRKDLENLWGIVKERFSTSKPTNFFDEYLFLTLKTMFEKPDKQDAVWKNQRSVHGLALV